MTKQYWYLEYLERIDEIGEWEEKTTCIARPPVNWLNCRQDHNRGMVEMKTDWYKSVSLELVSFKEVTREDYESFMNEDVIRR